MTYRIASFPITLGGFQGLAPRPVAGLLNAIFHTVVQLDKFSSDMSRGRCAIAELNFSFCLLIV